MRAKRREQSFQAGSLTRLDSQNRIQIQLHVRRWIPQHVIYRTINALIRWITETYPTGVDLKTIAVQLFNTCEQSRGNRLERTRVHFNPIRATTATQIGLLHAKSRFERGKD